MKARITVELTHCVNTPLVPPKDFVLTQRFQLDLPLESTEFVAAVDSIVAAHLTRLLTEMCAQLTEKVNVYTDDMKRQGVQQLELGFDKADK